MGFAEGAWKVLGFEERGVCDVRVSQSSHRHLPLKLCPRHSPSQRNRVAEFKGHALTIRAILVDFGKVHSIHFTLSRCHRGCRGGQKYSLKGRSKKKEPPPLKI